MAISSGWYHTCVLIEGGSVRCWGYNGSGQVGRPADVSTVTVATPVAGVAGATAVGAGRFHSCAIVAGGTVRCWGYNDFGQLGDGTTDPAFSPVDVVGVGDAVAVTGGEHHTCALIADGTVRCWGINTRGQLGDGTVSEAPSGPSTVLGIEGATAIAADGATTCALLGDGTVRCWGWGEGGELGNGAAANSSTPVEVSGLNDAVALAPGCSLSAGGAVRCWGGYLGGPLGNVPTEVTGIAASTAISRGGQTACAVVAAGSLRCWGLNSLGQLGNGTYDNILPPVDVDVLGVTGAVAASNGIYHSCALVTGGAVRCWGANVGGELGDGTWNPSLVSVSVLSAI